MTPYAMLYTVIAGVPVALAALALAGMLRRHGKPERGVWLVALALSFALPIAGLLRPARVDTAASAGVPETVIGLPEVVVIATPASGLDWGRIVLWAWLLASAVLLVRWAVASVRLSRASASWHPGSIDGVPVWMTDDVGPAVSGVVRPKVLAPAWLHDMPAGQRALILMHEQEHVRAKDPLLVAITRVAQILTPWNPVVWLVSARLVRAIELDCDRRVLRRTSDVAAYGRTLLTVSERRPSRRVLAAAFAESEAPLRSRILAMTTPPQTVSIVAILAATIFGVVLMIGALGIPVPTVRIDVQVNPSGTDDSERIVFRGAPPLPPPVPSPRPLPAAGVNTREMVARAPRVTTAPAPATNDAGASVPIRDAAVEQDQTVRISGDVGQGSPVRIVGTDDAPPNRQQIPDPTFSPMTVRPQLLNMEETQQALVREYPAALRDAGIGGAPVLWLYIDTEGTVAATRIYESSGNEGLDAAAHDVARVMRFSPAYNGDDRVAVWVQIPIRFAVMR